MPHTHTKAPSAVDVQRLCGQSGASTPAWSRRRKIKSNEQQTARAKKIGGNTLAFTDKDLLPSTSTGEQNEEGDYFWYLAKS